MEPLPADFLFGVACADHQFEAYDPAYPPDVWDWWEQRGEVPQARGWATDFWYRYPEQLLLAKNLGCNTFRFSIAWARVEPRPGEFDQDALKHYATLAYDIRQHGMEPIVTLCHYVWPMHLQLAGGLAGRNFPSRFAAYVRQVRDALQLHVRYWLTFNEPDDLVVSHSNLQPRFPPNAPAWTKFGDQVSVMEALIRNIFLAHRDARAILREGEAGATAMVSLNSDVRGFPIYIRRLLNWWVTRHLPSARGIRNVVGEMVAKQPTETMTAGSSRFYRTLALLFDGDWWEMGSLGRLPTHLCPEGCENQLDYLAFDWYYAVRWPWDIRKLAEGIDGHFERAPVYAPALYDVLTYFDRLFKQAYPPHGKPIIIAENGLVDQAGAFEQRGEKPPPDVVDQATYLRDHVRQVQRAHAAGVNVIGYCVWSLISNREWGLRLNPGTDFGLYRIDLDNDPALRDRSLPLTPIPGPAVETYREIIRRRGVKD
jgi:beta-glucosidase/6-phospho-beta-glucosidase/beta-galactosidase